MEKNDQSGQLGSMLREGLHTVPSPDFSETVIARHLSERKTFALKPDFDVSFVLIPAAVAAVLFIVLFYLKDAAWFNVRYAVSMEAIVDKLMIGLFAAAVFSLFAILCDIIEGGTTPAEGVLYPVKKQ